MTLQRDPHCRLCKLHETAEFVCLLGQGPKPCDIMIVGEAPGHREDESGKPFVGSAGQLLMRLLDEECGLDRADAFITNAVSCRPPDNRTPSRKEISACKKWLDYQMSIVKPKYVLLLGNVPLMSCLGLKGITKYRGKPIKKDGIIYLPTFHPSATFHNPGTEQPLRMDLKFFREIINAGEIPEERDLDYVIVDDPVAAQEMLDDLHGDVAWDTETTGLYPWAKDAGIVSIGFATERRQWCVPIGHPQSTWTRSDSVPELMRRIDQRMRDDCYLITHAGKFDTKWVYLHHGYKWLSDWDTLLADYNLDENRLHDLEALAKLNFGARGWDIDLKEKQGHGSLEAHCKYLALDVYWTRRIWGKQRKQFLRDPTNHRLFTKLTMPTARMFVDVEMRGYYVDVKRFAEVETKLTKDIAAADKDLKQYGDINWASPKQVAQLFYKELKLPVLQKTAKGAPSTAESVLKQLNHPAPLALMKRRGAQQQLSFFIDGWKPWLSGRRIHPSFKLHGTVTGRPSCENPNLQQVPRDPFIRSLIGAPPGYTLLEVDLSQIELRIAAELANERTMLNAFKNGVDAHWLTMIREFERSGAQKELVLNTASNLEGKPVRDYNEALDILLIAGPDKCAGIDKRWKELRKKAKAINFGYLYGMWWKKFIIYARDNYEVQVTDSEAQESRMSFFELYADFPDWHKKQQRFAQRNGYVRTMTGRKRRLPDAMAYEDTPRRAESWRQAINSPVQGFAAEMNLMMALQLYQEFPAPQLYIVGTVHDSILMEVRNDMLKVVHDRALAIAHRPKLFDDFEIEISVPLEAEAKVGNWGIGKNLER